MSDLKNNSIVIVIVLYKTNLENCSSYNTFCKSNRYLSIEWKLVLFNNSNDCNIKSDIATKVVNSSNNEMLNGAYNYALKYATDNNSRWLLLMDQDTEITDDYFIKLSEILKNQELEENTVAIIPSLKVSYKTISPHRISFFNSFRSSISNTGYITGHITAFNSLSLIEVKFLNSLGGFSSSFPLDMLDYWLFLQIFKQKKKIYLLDTVVNHSLSITDFEKNMTIERYKQLLSSEYLYILEFNLIHRLAYKTKLIYRSLKQFMIFSNKNFAKITFQNIFK